MNYSGVVTIIAAFAATGIFAVSFYLRGIKSKRYIRVKRLSLLDAVLSFTLAIGFRMITYVYFIWAEDVPVLSKSIEAAQSQVFNYATMTTIGMVTILLSIYLVAPIFEEVLFRGIVQKELCEALPVWVAILLQAIAFGWAHGYMVQTIFAAVFGIILGLLYYKTKNIKITILAHMFFNMSSTLELKNDDMFIQMVITGIGMTVASIFMFFYAYRKKHTPIEGENPGGNNNG